MTYPPVTVICLCYNQGRFVTEAIRSVLDQTYPNIQLLVVDDCSTDDSEAVIRETIALHRGIQFFPLPRNVGNCKAFNYALRHATGDFIIDLAADDVLLPERVSKGVSALRAAGEPFGVSFTDADWIAENGTHLYRHSERFPHASIPQGNIYRELIARFFICSPTMMFRRSVIDALGGYDEDLAYEDFDFWVRSSRHFCYCYTPEVLVKKRVVRHSMAQKQFSFFSLQLKSTFRVCEKVMALNRTRAEQKALGRRLLYETKICLRLLNFPLAREYAKLYVKNTRLSYRC